VLTPAAIGEPWSSLSLSFLPPWRWDPCHIFVPPKEGEGLLRLWFYGVSLARLSASPSFPGIVRTFSPKRYSERLWGCSLGQEVGLH